ncbi:glycosyltransferase family 2 protein [Plantactinospora mayteni]|uniref:glycosyltransferase family 2 protein n=1 Tax=Plantactinospora mayteni TaxID=566021 RepID=UPI0027DAE125|nr:glycosyltransferase family 2 protein [Plantactinospora mayteni]
MLSVVIPMYNEESALPIMSRRLRGVLDALGDRYEVVAVDDGSADRTAEVLRELRADWPELRVVSLRRNSGHQAALLAGLMRASGDYLVSIDADLQDPPEVIPEMLRLAQRDGLHVVYGVRSDRSTDTAFKRGTASAYYRLMRKLAGRHVPAQAGDFRLLSRDVVEVLRELPERTPVLRVVVPWLGFASGEVSYLRAERVAGETKYPLSRMVRLAADSVTSFSAAPLRIATWFGAAGMVVSSVLIVMAFVRYLAGATVPGWASVFVAVLFFGAVQMLFLGLLGEYVGRIYTAIQGRPAYLIAEDSIVAGESLVGRRVAADGADPGRLRQPEQRSVEVSV